MKPIWGVSQGKIFFNHGEGINMTINKYNHANLGVSKGEISINKYNQDNIGRFTRSKN